MHFFINNNLCHSLFDNIRNDQNIEWLQNDQHLFGQLRNYFTDGYKLTNFVGYEMARLQNDYKPFSHPVTII